MRDTLVALLMLGVAAATTAFTKERKACEATELFSLEDEAADFKALLQKAILR